MSFDEVLVQQGAPCLCGIKSASMFSMNLDTYGQASEKVSLLNETLRREGIVIFPIQKAGRMLFFVYNRHLLEKILSRVDALEYLRKRNYPVNKGFDSILMELFFRLMGDRSFPHEVGLFLGYPLEDVIEFERTEGKGALHTGYWKVYGNKDSSINVMNMYRACSRQCLEHLLKGVKLMEALSMYKNK